MHVFKNMMEDWELTRIEDLLWNCSTLIMCSKRSMHLASCMCMPAHPPMQQRDWKWTENVNFSQLKQLCIAFYIVFVNNQSLMADKIDAAACTNLEIEHTDTKLQGHL